MSKTLKCIALAAFLIAFPVVSGCIPNPNPVNYYNLTTHVVGSGKVSPSGGVYVQNTKTSLWAIPQAGWSFDHWEGALTGSANPQSVTFTNDVTVTAVFVSSSANRKPTAYDLSATTDKNQSLNVTLLADDKDSDPLSYGIVSGPSHGTLSGSAPDITYQPTGWFTGSDSFTYRASDGTDYSNTAKVSVLVIDPAPTGWARTFGSTGSDIVHDVAVSSSGNVYMVGSFKGTVDFDPSSASSLHQSSGGSDAFLAKFSLNGNLDWVRTIGGSSDDIAYSVAVDSNENIYVVGRFGATVIVDGPSGKFLVSKGGTDAFIAKFSAAGLYQWAYSIGGPADDTGNSAGLDATGNVFIAGAFAQTVNFDPTGGTDNMIADNLQDAFVTKFSATGIYSWTATVGGMGTDVATGVAGDGAGNMYLTGYFSGSMYLDPNSSSHQVTSAGQSDMFVVKLSHDSSYIWGYAIGGAGEDRAMAIVSDSTGNVVLGGYFGQTVDFDPSSGVNVITSAGKADGFVLSLNATGNFRWAEGIGGSDDDVVQDVALESASGNVYAAGGFTGTVDFDFGPTVDNITSNSNSLDAFITKITASGSYIFTRTFGGTGTDIANGVYSADSSLLTYLGGAYQQSVDFDPRATTQEHTSFGNDDAFLIKMNSTGGW